MRVGIFFGGNSREREVSFAGGRTVFDNLDKTLFTPVPIFIDSYLNLCLIQWPYLYKGSIRDFYDPDLFPDYQEQDRKEKSAKYLARFGVHIPLEDLKNHIDFGFLALHGINGEDGRFQGLLEWLGIPYSGSGLISSGIGMDKALQNRLMSSFGLPVTPSLIVTLNQWKKMDKTFLFDQAKQKIGLPLVLKAAHQGSSIGVNILREDSFRIFKNLVDKTFFIETLKTTDWNSSKKTDIIRHLLDYREGPGLPVKIGQRIINNKAGLIEFLDEKFGFGEPEKEVQIEGVDSENTILLEQFIEGKEFSCIVIDNLNGNPLALPPTEIRKSSEVFSYRSKYLPGLSHKITPIDEDNPVIQNIIRACENLYTQMGFKVYARIDGFLNRKGEIFLNDPNTTSGMMPSSFFFHQAAEIGLNPSQFLTYIISASINARLAESARPFDLIQLASDFDRKLKESRLSYQKKLKVGILLGGYSSERHISVESGRNIYEKLSSSPVYEPIPIFLTGLAGNYEFYKIPINILLKDNADDIGEKIKSFQENSTVLEIISAANDLIKSFSNPENLHTPEKWTYERIKNEVDFVFIALHGRPGEDGEIQLELDKLGIPYNGSGVESSKLTIDKYLTNELLKKNGIKIPKHRLLFKQEWEKEAATIIKDIKLEFGFPLIAKPSDDGCSSAVIKINSEEEFRAYTDLLFREIHAIPQNSIQRLHLNPKEEFPLKELILIEELISAAGTNRFMEITGGVFTQYNQKGEMEYIPLEPSEALAGKDVLSLEEKFLAGEGQNITPPRYAENLSSQKKISTEVKEQLGKVAKILGVEGYCRIDAFVKIYDSDRVEIIIIEANSLPGMTPATAIFHQSAYAGYKPYDFIDQIIKFGQMRKQKKIS